MKVKQIEDFKIGDKEHFSKTISESDVYLYAGITGDLAPHHVNADYAQGTRFGERIAHGLLIAGVMSSALTKLVAPGAVTLSHEVFFLAPVYFGDTVYAEVEVREIDLNRRALIIRTVVRNQKGVMVLDGTAVEKFPKISREERDAQ
ncbi:MAG: MaoC family dehydratase [Syntrophaceae bacterium]|jgi:3-hydroxybutyryl-CoA dehydratase|nr:MaoC family dehydratase [Syntrophaceae bacterium]